ncbi:hypothetical protein H1235_03980 [Pseudoxanthomonas sp. NC8]|nr:hypothetical protein H1235_03980 [Pseudoxanthomonas sp. NC8]
MRLSALFFLSGFAALTYQVCWQKQLNALLGVDTLSIVIVVVAFMLGLGVGAVVGGDTWPTACARSCFCSSRSNC